MSTTPESMLFTWEFDAVASRGVARAQAPAVAPSLLSQLADASRAQTPLAPVAMPDELRLVIQDPEGEIHVSVGRDERDVTVKVDVPTGLMAAVKEAEAPIRASLQDDGYQLEDYDVQERDVDAAPKRDQPEHHAPRGRRPLRRHAQHSSKTSETPTTQNPGPRLLDRRA